MILNEKTKMISIGGGCYSNILLTRLDKLTGLNIRVPGPIDNLRSLHGIEGSLKLFDGSLQEQLLGENASFQIEKKKAGKQSFDEVDFNFVFEDFAIIHNDYRKEKYKANLKTRFENLKAFYQEAKTNPNYFFLYTLCQFDRKSIGRLKIIKQKFQELGIDNKIIFVGTSIAPVKLENETKSNTENWPDFNWPEWTEVFGKNYIILRNCDYYDLGAKLFLTKLKEL